MKSDINDKVPEEFSTIYAKFIYPDGFVEEKSIPGNVHKFYGIKHAGTRPIKVEIMCETSINDFMLKSLLYALHPINREIIINGASLDIAQINTNRS